MHNVIQPAPRWVRNVPMILIGTSSTTGVTAISVPAGTQNGDLMVMAVLSRGSLSSVSGWTLRREYTADPYYIKVYSRVASSEPGTYSTGYSAGGLAAVMLVYRNATGVDTVGSLLREDQPGGGAGNTSIVAPSLTAAASGKLLGIFFRSGSSAGIDTSAVSSMTNRVGASHTYTTGRVVALRVFDAAQIAGATGDKTANVTGSTGGVDFGMLMQIY